jgi:hypothetical protein
MVVVKRETSDVKQVFLAHPSRTLWRALEWTKGGYAITPL